MLVPNWHPLFVHFPLALVVTAAAALTLARWLPGGRMAESVATWGTWNLCAGAVGVYVALGSGLAAVIGLNVDAAARHAVTSHVKAAVVTTLLVTCVAVWRGAGAAARSRPSMMFLLVLWAATVALIVTGYRGGQNVFQHGIGVVTEAAKAP